MCVCVCVTIVGDNVGCYSQQYMYICIPEYVIILHAHVLPWYVRMHMYMCMYICMYVHVYLHCMYEEVHVAGYETNLFALVPRVRCAKKAMKQSYQNGFYFSI